MCVCVFVHVRVCISVYKRIGRCVHRRHSLYRSSRAAVTLSALGARTHWPSASFFSSSACLDAIVAVAFVVIVVVKAYMHALGCCANSHSIPLARTALALKCGPAVVPPRRIRHRHRHRRRHRQALTAGETCRLSIAHTARIRNVLREREGTHAHRHTSSGRSHCCHCCLALCGRPEPHMRLRHTQTHIGVRTDTGTDERVREKGEISTLAGTRTGLSSLWPFVKGPSCL
jgi:hypothetical protein